MQNEIKHTLVVYGNSNVFQALTFLPIFHNKAVLSSFGSNWSLEENIFQNLFQAKNNWTSDISAFLKSLNLSLIQSSDLEFESLSNFTTGFTRKKFQILEVQFFWDFQKSEFILEQNFWNKSKYALLLNQKCTFNSDPS